MTADDPGDVSAVVSDAAALLEGGRAHAAIDLLDRAHRASGDPVLAACLVDVRHRAFECLDRTVRPPACSFAAGEPDRSGTIPIHGPEDLTVEALRGGLARNGCLWVRGLLDADLVEDLRRGIDRTLESYDRVLGGAPLEDAMPWYAPFQPGRAYAEYRVGGRRNWIRASGALWTADSPAMLAKLTQTLTDVGLSAVIAGHLGERPALSVNKCSLRRVPVDSGGAWHQDGAFLGEDIRTVNVWIALDDCGRDAPGLDVVPTRIDSVVDTGGEGATFDWSVSDEAVRQASRGVPAIRPEFGAGDVLLFDQLFLHRTACEPEMTSERHAIESWFFAPSAYPDEQIPLLF